MQILYIIYAIIKQNRIVNVLSEMFGSWYGPAEKGQIFVDLVESMSKFKLSETPPK